MNLPFFMTWVLAHCRRSLWDAHSFNFLFLFCCSCNGIVVVLASVLHPLSMSHSHILPELQRAATEFKFGDT